jgi:hypothetical protein
MPTTTKPSAETPEAQLSPPPSVPSQVRDCDHATVAIHAKTSAPTSARPIICVAPLIARYLLCLDYLSALAGQIALFGALRPQAPQRRRCVNRWLRFRAAEFHSPHCCSYSTPFRGRLSRGWSKCANTSFTTRPLLPSPLPTLQKSRRTSCRISYPTYAHNRRHANDGTYLSRRCIPHEPHPTHANSIVHIYQQTGKTTAKPHDDGTPPHNSCASGSNATNNTATPDYKTCPKLPNASPEKPRPTSSSVCCNSTNRPATDAERLARHLAQQGIPLSPHTIRHILRRHAPQQRPPRKPRRRLYPAHWAWKVKSPLRLFKPM